LVSDIAGGVLSPAPHCCAPPGNTLGSGSTGGTDTHRHGPDASATELPATAPEDAPTSGVFKIKVIFRLSSRHYDLVELR